MVARQTGSIVVGLTCRGSAYWQSNKAVNQAVVQYVLDVLLTLDSSHHPLSSHFHCRIHISRRSHAPCLMQPISK